LDCCMKRETVPRSTRGCVVVPCCGAARWVLMLLQPMQPCDSPLCVRFAIAWWPQLLKAIETTTLTINHDVLAVARRRMR
jgi:hypothetical protein